MDRLTRRKMSKRRTQRSSDESNISSLTNTRSFCFDNTKVEISEYLRVMSGPVSHPRVRPTVGQTSRLRVTPIRFDNDCLQKCEHILWTQKCTYVNSSSCGTGGDSLSFWDEDTSVLPGTIKSAGEPSRSRTSVGVETWVSRRVFSKSSTQIHQWLRRERDRGQSALPDRMISGWTTVTSTRSFGT